MFHNIPGRTEIAVGPHEICIFPPNPHMLLLFVEIAHTQIL